MWRSVVTCIPVQIKPISKRSEHAIEDLQLLQQEQLLHDPTGLNRQVLPNIRPVPKSKFRYKGLAYKEVKKIPGMNREDTTATNNNTNTLKKPLIDYNLAQAYIRHEVNAARTKQLAAPPTSTMTKTHTSLDLREMRKRIIKGTTVNSHPIPQSASWRPRRVDNKTTIGSEVHLPLRGLSTLNSAPTISPLAFQQHPTIHTTPILSIDNITNISLL